jgi:hypothetical protein
MRGIPSGRELSPAPVSLRYREAAISGRALVVFISEEATDVADMGQRHDKSQTFRVQLLFMLMEYVVDHVAKLRRK